MTLGCITESNNVRVDAPRSRIGGKSTVQTFDLEVTDRSGMNRPASRLIVPTRRRLLTGALATASFLAAPAIVKAQAARRSIDSFGDGATQRSKSEATADWTACFNAAADSGTPVEVPPGRYPFRTQNSAKASVYVNAARNIDFVCAPNAEFIVGYELNNKSGSLFSFTNPSGPDNGVKFSFRGGYFDGRALDVVPEGGSGLGMMSIFQYADPILSGMRGYGGKNNPMPLARGAGFTDTFISTHGCIRENITNIHGRGFYDSLLYVSGQRAPLNPDRGRLGTVTGLVALGCGNGIAIKRNYIGLTVVDCAIWYCQNGILSGTADGLNNNEGKQTRVIGGSIARIQGLPVVVCGDSVVVTNLAIGDYGLDLANPRVLHNRDAALAAITLAGCTNGEVINNQIVTRSVASDTRRGIALRRDQAGNVTTGCTVEKNDIVGPSSTNAIYKEPGSENNTIGSNP